MTFGDKLLSERFWNKVIPEPNSGCWIWIGSIGSHGYGDIWSPKDRRVVLAHRLVMEAANGLHINSRSQVDHLCRVRGCVNPDHLEVVSQTENIRRQGAAVTACPKGHEYTAENTRIQVNASGGISRKCRECGRQCVRARARLLREASHV